MVREFQSGTGRAGHASKHSHLVRLFDLAPRRLAMDIPSAPRCLNADAISLRRPTMKKLTMLCIIGSTALFTAAPFSLQWSQNNISLSVDRADARVGRSLTATSVARVNRRVHRRAYRRVYSGY